MILELWDFITTPASLEARKKGYLYNSIALAYRAKRCQDSWQSHLRECHRLIERIVRQVKPKKVCILGSGLMLETPAHLFAQCEEVHLVDIVHLKQVRAQKLDPKFKFVEMDLTEKFPQVKYDLIISANILAQLSMIKGLTPEEIQFLHLVHFDNLRKSGASFLIFSDFKLEYLNPKGEVTKTEDTVQKSTLDSLQIAWQHVWKWNVAPIPEYSKKIALRMLVGSYSELTFKP